MSRVLAGLTIMFVLPVAGILLATNEKIIGFVLICGCFFSLIAIGVDESVIK
jgi:hypothetical protein